MKALIKKILHTIFGYENYLFVFSIYTVYRLRLNRHEREYAHFLKMVPDEGAILDIGANVGAMTSAMATSHPNATIYAFEPIPSNMQVLKRVLQYFKLKNVKVFEIAVGETSGVLDMVLPIMNGVKMHGMCHEVKKNDNSEWNRGINFQVPLKNLDAIAELQSISKITAIKIDVENFEYYVFRGGKELLLKHKPIIYCELWTNELRDVCLEYMRGLGYEVNVFVNGTLVPFTTQNDTNFFLVYGNA